MYRGERPYVRLRSHSIRKDRPRGGGGVGYTKNIWSNSLFYIKKYLPCDWAAVNCFNTQRAGLEKE
jgi:hypothetical protein